MDYVIVSTEFKGKIQEISNMFSGGLYASKKFQRVQLCICMQQPDQILDSSQIPHPREISPTNINLYIPYISRIQSTEIIWDYILEWGPRLHYKTLTTIIKRLVQLPQHSQQQSEQKQKILDAITDMTFRETPAFDGTFFSVLLWGYHKTKLNLTRNAQVRIMKVFKEKYTDLQAQQFVNALWSLLRLGCFAPKQGVGQGVMSDVGKGDHDLFIDQMIYFANDELLSQMKPKDFCLYVNTVLFLRLKDPEIVELIENQFFENSSDFSLEQCALLLSLFSGVRNQVGVSHELNQGKTIERLIHICEKNIDELKAHNIVSILGGILKLKQLDKSIYDKFINQLIQSDLSTIREKEIAIVSVGLTKRGIHNTALLDVFSNRLIKLNNTINSIYAIADFLTFCMQCQYRNDQLFKQLAKFAKEKILELNNQKILDVAWMLKDYDPNLIKLAINQLGSQKQFTPDAQKLPQLLQILSEQQNPDKQIVQNYIQQLNEQLPQSDYSPSELFYLFKSVALLRHVHTNDEITTMLMEFLSTRFDQLISEQLVDLAQICYQTNIQLQNQVSFQLAIIQCDFQDVNVDQLVKFLSSLMELELLNESIWVKAMDAKGPQLSEGGISDILQDMVVKGRLKGMSIRSAR
eukprot:TRINITY_DN14757_c1_g1_i5.p1 TRINITY_DN14757_c1_g1~~TRINITY_DN14757_c1_g1_i5.p1  ORF type:complete len:635 (-),score=72.50 TRINITY_DN14757_c1_g1_i5:72-1976(-)